MGKISKDNDDEFISSDSNGLLNHLKKEMEDFFLPKQTYSSENIPSVDMFSTDEGLTIEIELPGLTLKDIELSTLKNTIIVKARKEETEEEKEDLNFICLERSPSGLFRVIELPFPVHSGKSNATYSRGILTINLPKITDKRGAPKIIPINECDK